MEYRDRSIAEWTAWREADAALRHGLTWLKASLARNTAQLEHLTKAATAPATTTSPSWAGLLMPPAALEALQARMREQTVLARLRVPEAPWKVNVPFLGSLPASLSWVTEAKVKPAIAFSFASGALSLAKISGIVVLSRELVSADGTENVIMRVLVHLSTTTVDEKFLSPSAVAGATYPGSLTSAIAPVAPTGTVDGDVSALVAAFFSARPGARRPTFVASSPVLARVAASGHHPALPATLLGLPVVVSAGGGNALILIDAEAVYARDDGAAVDRAEDATIELQATPMDPPNQTVVLTSLWQNNLVGIRLDRFVSWIAEPSAAAWVSVP